MSIDPVTTDANTGGSFNRYVYANDNPFRYTDPDGRFSRRACADMGSMNCETIDGDSGGGGKWYRTGDFKQRRLLQPESFQGRVVRLQ